MIKCPSFRRFSELQFIFYGRPKCLLLSVEKSLASTAQ